MREFEPVLCLDCRGRLSAERKNGTDTCFYSFILSFSFTYLMLIIYTFLFVYILYIFMYCLIF